MKISPWSQIVLMNPLQVTFHYIGYNESGRRIDSSYMQGSPAKIRMGTNALVPGNITSMLYNPTELKGLGAETVNTCRI